MPISPEAYLRKSCPKPWKIEEIRFEADVWFVPATTMWQITDAKGDIVAWFVDEEDAKAFEALF